MKRTSKKPFSQLMINNSLKHELDRLKLVVAKKILATWNLSYGDVISYLVEQFDQTQKIEYPIEEKLLSSNSIDKSVLKVSIPLKKVNASGVTVKLDGKKWVSYTLDS